VSTELKPK